MQNYVKSQYRVKLKNKVGQINWFIIVVID